MSILRGFYGINGYNLYGPKMTRVEICGTEVIIGRVNVRQRRNGKTVYRDMQRYEQRQLGELNKRDVFFNCLPNNDLSKIALKFSI